MIKTKKYCSLLEVRVAADSEIGWTSERSHATRQLVSYVSSIMICECIRIVKIDMPFKVEKHLRGW